MSLPILIIVSSVTIISILRLASIRNYASTSNPTWDQYDVLWWSVIEINVGFMCTCFPAMRLILIRMAPRVFGSESGKPPLYVSMAGVLIWDEENICKTLTNSHLHLGSL